MIAPTTPGAHGSKAMFFAWLVEMVAVLMGLTMAVFAGVEGSDGGAATVVASVLPFVALSIVELTKIPLVGLAFAVTNPCWRVVAMLALLCISAATFENFVFGFERGFNERLRAVENAEQQVKTDGAAVVLARSRLPTLAARQADLDARLAALRNEVAAIRAQAQQDIADTRSDASDADSRAERTQIQQDLAGLDRRRDVEVARERARCGAPNTTCNIATILASYRRQSDALGKRLAALSDRQQNQQDRAGASIEAARGKRDAEIVAKDRERTEATAELDHVRADLSAAQEIVLQGDAQVARAEHVRDDLIERSQLHRLAQILFGDHAPGQLEQTKRLFVLSLAGIVAMIGSVIAAMHHAARHSAERAALRAIHPAQRPARRVLLTALRGYLARKRLGLPVSTSLREGARQSFKTSRAVRAYYLRKRKPLVVVRKQVETVMVDRLKLVFLPLNSSEADVAAARRNALGEAA